MSDLPIVDLEDAYDDDSAASEDDAELQVEAPKRRYRRVRMGELMDSGAAARMKPVAANPAMAQLSRARQQQGQRLASGGKNTTGT